MSKWSQVQMAVFVAGISLFLGLFAFWALVMLSAGIPTFYVIMISFGFIAPVVALLVLALTGRSKRNATQK